MPQAPLPSPAHLTCTPTVSVPPAATATSRISAVDQLLYHVISSGAVCVLHNASTSEQRYDLSSLGGHAFSVLAASIGQGGATLDGSVLTLDPQTSAVLREG